MTTGRAARLGSFFVLLVMLALPAQAADVTLNASDGFGTTSFNAAGGWDSAAAPTAGNDYFTSNYSLRTPPDNGSYTFAGDSLTVNNTNGYPQGLFYKGTGNTGIITIDNLILDGGYISHGNGPADVFQLDGNISVLTDSVLHAKQGPIDVLANISGSGTISNPSSDNTGVILSFLSPTSTFTGSVVNNGRFTLADDAVMNFVIGASGVNNSVSGTGAETIFDGDFVFDLSGASSTPGDSWNIAAASNQSFGETFTVSGFSQSGDFWTDGTYLFNTTNGVLSISAPPISWDVDGGGDWSTTTNWIDDTPPSAGDDVLFGSVLTADNAPATINLDTNVSVSRVSFSNANQYILSGANTLTLTDLAQISAGSGTHEVAVVIDGSIGLTKTGTGDIILSADNTYTGTTTVQAGALRILNVGAVDGAAVVESGGTLFFQGDGEGGGYDGTFSGNISGAGEVALSNTLTTETVTFSSAKSYTGQTSVNGGTLQVSGAGTLGASDGTATTRTLVAGNEATGKVALSGGIAIGNEVLTLGARELSAIDAVHLTSDGNNSWAGNVKGQTGGTQYNIESTSGTLTLSGTISAPDTATRNFVFDGAGNVNITGRLVDLATDDDGVDLAGPVNALSNVNVIKRGTGTLTISTGGTNLSTEANNFYRGTTVIEEGTLAVVDSQTADAGELFTSSIAIQQGATFDTSAFDNYSLQVVEDPDTIPYSGDEFGQVVTGSGTINTGSGRILAYEDSVITPGDEVGTLSVTGNMTINQSAANPNGALNYDLGSATTVGSGVSDLLAVSGNLRLLADGAAGGGQFQLNVTPTGGTLATTPYTLMTAGNTTGSNATAADFTVALVTADGTPINSRQDDAATVSVGANAVTVTFSPAQTFNWTGATNGTWDVGTTNNWSSTDQKFFDLDKVTFPNGTGQTTVDVAGPVAPGSMTFTNTTDTYTFTGGAIEGNGPVTLNAGAKVVLATANTNLGGNVSLGSGAVLQQGDGSSTGNNTLTGVVSGSGGLTVQSGQIVLTGANDYTGVTTINGGTLITANATAMGSTAAGTIINGGSLRSNGDTYTSNEPITLNGGSLAVGGGGPAAVTFAGDITVGASGGTIQVDGDTGEDGLTVSGNIGGTGGGTLTANVGSNSTMTVPSNITNNGTLSKTGGGSLALTGAATVAAPMISVAGGSLNVTGLSSTFTVASGQTISGSGSGTVTGNVIAATGSTVRVGGAGLSTSPSQFVIDDFESYSLGDVNDVANPPWTAHASSTYSDIEDDGTGNQVLAYGHDNASAPDYGGASRAMPADGVISDGDIATFFYRVNSKQDDPDHSFGLSDGTDTGAGWFADYEAQVALVDDGDAGNGTFNLVVRNGGGTTTAATGLTPNTWYNIWIVVDQTTDTYDVYQNTGTGDATGGDQVASGFGFRNGTTAPLNTILAFWAPAPIDNQVMVDSLTYLDGVDLTNPLGGLSPVNIFHSETMTVDGDLTLDAGATLALDIFDPQTLDLLTVTGSLVADGTLEITLDASAPTPSLGDTFDILDFGSASGAFAALNLPGLASGLTWNTSDLLTTGILEVVSTGGLIGDYNEDGIVDAADYTVWRDKLGDDGSTLANRDPGNSGVISEDDYASWKSNFGMTSGSGSLATGAVPEPGTLWMALLVLCGAPFMRRHRGGCR